MSGETLSELKANPDLRALLEAIQRHPDEVTPHHILADWLEDRGLAERAELIHIQCALAGNDLSAEDRATLEERQQFLLSWLDEHWLRPLLSGPGSEWHFERGLPVSVRLSWRTFLDKGAELFEATGVQFFDLGREQPAEEEQPDFRALGEFPLLTRVRSFDLAGLRLTPQDIEGFLKSPYLSGLEQLDLRDNVLWAEGAVLLASCPNLRSLRVLNLSGNDLGDAGLQALLRQDGPFSLRQLDLSHNSITDVGLAALAHSPLLAELELLDLSQNAIGNIGVILLADSPYLRSLRGLDLSKNFIGNSGVQALARCPALAHLTGLSLDDNPFGREGIQALRNSSSLAHLFSGRLWLRY